MKLENYTVNSDDFRSLAEAGSLAGSRALLRAATIKRDEIRDRSERTAQICDEDFKRDIRFNLGYVAAMNWLLGLPEQAKQHINKLPNKEM